MAGNDFGPEGARVLSEPLGKLTALQHLDLRGKIFYFIFIWEGCVLRLRERDMGGVLLCFLLALQGTALGVKGQGFCRSRSAS
jgi:hypothetical protein